MLDLRPAANRHFLHRNQVYPEQDLDIEIRPGPRQLGRADEASMKDDQGVPRSAPVLPARPETISAGPPQFVRLVSGTVEISSFGLVAFLVQWITPLQEIQMRRAERDELAAGVADLEGRGGKAELMTCRERATVHPARMRAGKEAGLGTRFGAVEAVPAGHRLAFLSDNGGAYIAHDMRRIARSLGLTPINTPVCSSQSKALTS